MVWRHDFTAQSSRCLLPLVLRNDEFGCWTCKLAIWAFFITKETSYFLQHIFVLVIHAARQDKELLNSKSLKASSLCTTASTLHLQLRVEDQSTYLRAEVEDFKDVSDSAYGSGALG